MTPPKLNTLKKDSYYNNTNDSIPDRFEATAAKYADRPAAQADKKALTYNELNTLANRIAHAIYNDTPSTKKASVAVCMRPGLTLPAGIFAVLKSGNCYVPLEPSQPADRNASIVSDADVAILLTDSRDMLAATAIVSRSYRRIQIINVDQISDASSSSFDAREKTVSPDDICAIIYTSGSTGRPKRALVIPIVIFCMPPTAC